MRRTHLTEFSELRERSGMTIEDAARFFDVDLRTIYRWDRGDVRVRKSVLRQLRSAGHGGPVAEADTSFRFIDLFAGIGGLRLGFEAAGGRCVWTSEWDRWSRMTYNANFRPDHEIAGDITRIPASEVPEHDVLLAGFPCQPFSLAGVSKKNSLGREHGFRCDAQGTLFFDVARIIEHHRPAAFLLENVRNLLSHDRGKTFEIIRRTLADELGYHVDWRVIDAKGWVPQHRQRIFIAGFRKDSGFSFEDMPVRLASEGPRLQAILHSEDGSEDPEEPYTCGVKARVSERYVLSDHLWKYLQDYAAGHRAKGNGFGYGLVGPEHVARTLSARYHKDGSEILVARRGGNPRRLTPRECARLMGFDAPDRVRWRIPVSDTQAYRQFGNAVVVPVVRDVARHMRRHILHSMGSSDPASEPELPLRMTVAA